MFERRERGEKQSEFLVAADRLPAAVPSAFYRRVSLTRQSPSERMTSLGASPPSTTRRTASKRKCSSVS
jgi:hypothetical protein